MGERMKAKPALPTEVQFHYLKSQQFRVVHVDGIVGGLTPRGVVSMVAYSERVAIPQVTIHDIDKGVLVQKPRDQMGRSGIVREMEVDMMLDISTAKALHKWLGERLVEAKKLLFAKAKKEGQE